MEKINWTEYVIYTDLLQRVKEKRNILPTIKGWKSNWIGHMLRRNCGIKRVAEGKIEGRT